MSSGGSGRERSRKDFLNTDFEQRFRLSVGPRLTPGLAQLGRKFGANWAQVGPKLAQIGPKLAFCWAKSAQVSPSWPQDGLRWPKLAQVGVVLAVGRRRSWLLAGVGTQRTQRNSTPGSAQNYRQGNCK